MDENKDKIFDDDLISYKFGLTNFLDTTPEFPTHLNQLKEKIKFSFKINTIFEYNDEPKSSDFTERKKSLCFPEAITYFCDSYIVILFWNGEIYKYNLEYIWYTNIEQFFSFLYDSVFLKLFQKVIYHQYNEEENSQYYTHLDDVYKKACLETNKKVWEEMKLQYKILPTEEEEEKLIRNWNLPISSKINRTRWIQHQQARLKLIPSLNEKKKLELLLKINEHIIEIDKLKNTIREKEKEINELGKKL